MIKFDKNNRIYLYITAIISIILLFFAWLFFYAVPGRPTPLFWVMLAITVVSITLLIIFDKKNIVNFFKLRSFHKAVTSSVILFLAILILVGIYLFIINFPIRFDMTKDKVYTISEQTIETLNQVKEPISILVFRSPSEDPNSSQWKADIVLKEYMKRNKNIKVQYVNPDQEPLLARKHQMTEYGETVFVYKQGKRARVLARDIARITYNKMQEQKEEFIGEQKFTQAIYSLIEQSRYTLYFTTGHGEKLITDQSRFGVSFLASYLESENYQVKTLNTLTSQKIPEDASLIIITAPISTFLPEEKYIFTKYVLEGGKALLLYDTILDGNQSNLDDWLLDFGFKVAPDFVIDVSSSVMIPVNIIPQYGTHEITETLRQNNIPSCFVVARSIRAVKPKYEGSITNIVFTSKDSYGKVEPTFDVQKAKFNPEIDIPGPVALGMIGTYTTPNKNKKGQVAVFGDSHFVYNGYISVQSASDFVFAGNKDLILNTVAYLLNVKQKITIRPKNYDSAPLTLTTTQSNIIVIIVQIVLPVIFAAIGAFVWFKRRL